MRVITRLSELSWLNDVIDATTQGVRVTKTMAEVLAEHQISIAWENGEERGITCLCGEDLPAEQERGEIDMSYLAAHQAAALSAAGFGLVADAGSKALEDAAQAIDSHRPEMGPGINITQYREGRNDAFAKAADTCRARAAAVRTDHAHD